MKKQIAKSIVRQKNSCRLLEMSSCACLSLKEIEIYVRAVCPALGPDFKLTVDEKIKDRFAVYIEVDSTGDLLLRESISFRIVGCCVH